ncbi:MAG TPA: glycosyltransferase family 1 protein [Herpetosiphonaceae bacterium]
MLIGVDASRLGVSARTGTEHYTWELLQALGEVDRHNRYLLYCNGLPQVVPPLPPSFVLRSIPLPRAWSHGRLSLEMLLHAPDLLFVPAHALPIVPPRRSVVTIHDLGFLHHPEAHTRVQRIYYRLFTRLSARRATRIIAISEATKRDLQRFYGTPAEKIAVIYHGVHARFKPIADRALLDQVQQRYGIAQPYLLFVSTIQPRKNVSRLIEAFAQARALLGAAQMPLLVLAGKRGWMTEQIERRADDLGVADQVRFVGYVHDADLPALLSGALAYLMVSLYEGFGMTVLEAQACGTPVIASNVSSLPEVVGDAGLLVDPYDVVSMRDAIVRLVQDANLRAELRERGLHHAVDWTWERTARQTLAVLEDAGHSA